jgi:hypothetical protein
MRVRIIVAGVTAAAALGLGMPSANAATWKSCGSISFAEGSPIGSSHYGVKDIRALRTGCATARSVARDVENARDYQYTSHGFACTGRSTGEGYGAYVCIKTKVDRNGRHDKVRFTTLGLG